MPLTPEQEESYLNMARQNYRTNKAFKIKQAEDKAKNEKIAKDRDLADIVGPAIAHLFQGTGAAAAIEHAGENRMKFAGLTFTPIKRTKNIGVVYTCNVCGNEHVYPTPDQYDLGAYLDNAQEIANTCPEPPTITETPETRLIAAIRDFIAAGG